MSVIVFKELISSILAGMAISLGCIVSMSVENRIVGAILFAVGMFIVCTLGLNLFTGKVCYVFEFSVDLMPFDRIPFLITDWFGNFIGAFIVSRMVHHTRLAPTIIKKAVSIAETKLNDTYVSLFILGILCSFCIFVAVENYKMNEHGILKALGLFISIPVFILCGFEHCVADMFFFLTAGIDVYEMFNVLLTVTLGNTIGGIVIKEAVDYIHIPEKW